MSTKYRTLFWPLETETDRSSALAELPVLVERRRHEGSVQENGPEHIQTEHWGTKEGDRAGSTGVVGAGSRGKCV